MEKKFMSLVNIISAVGNNSSIYPLIVRDCGVEVPVKIGMTYSQNLKDSKEMAADHLGIGQMGSANYKALANRAKKAADFYSKLSDSYKNTPVSALSKKQIKKAKDFKKHGYLDNVSYNDFNLKYDQEKYGL